MAVRPLAGQRDEQAARRDEPRIDGAAADRAIGAGQEAAAGQRGELVGGERRHPTRRSAGATGPTSVTASSLAWDALTGRRSLLHGSVGRRSRSGALIASVATRRNSSNDMTGSSSWPPARTVGVPSSMRTAITRSGWSTRPM